MPPRATRQFLRALILLAVAAALSPVAGLTQQLRDNFASRQLLTSTNGSIDANNSSATIEPGEPMHGGKRGGRSLWISWIAPTNGVLKTETSGSTFDTLLSACSFASPTNTGLYQLIERARADDSEGFEFESEVRFGVLARPLTGTIADTSAEQSERAVLHQAGLSLNYQHACGGFAQWESAWYRQHNSGYANPARPGDDFWQHNLWVGYRFPRRHAELRLGLLNLADQNYRLNPLNTYVALPRGRTVAASVRLNF